MNKIATSWNPKILFVGKNLRLEMSLIPAFERPYHYQSIRNPQVAKNILEKNSYDIILIDEELFKDYSSDNENVTFAELYQNSLMKNPKIIFFVLFSNNSHLVKNFTKQNESTLFLNKETISCSKISFALEILKRKETRCVSVKDIVPHLEYPYTFYWLDLDSNEYKPINTPNTKFGEDNMEWLRKNYISQVFLPWQDFYKLLYDTTNKNTKLMISEQLNQLRKKLKLLYVNLLDDSHDHAIASGKSLFKDATSIYSLIDSLYKNFHNSHDFLTFAPFVRTSLFSHFLNNAFYSYAFANIKGSQYIKEITIAALIHEVGLSLLDFDLLKKHKDQFSELDRLTYELHPQNALELLKKKSFPMSKTISECILQHHELNNGLGFPHGSVGQQHSLEVKIIQIADALDRVRLSSPKNIYQNIGQSLVQLQKQNEQNSIGPKFDPDVLHSLVRQLGLRQAA